MAELPGEDKATAPKYLPEYRHIMCNCGQYMRISPTWQLPALIQCVKCGAEWCQISWGKNDRER